jgi:hypothetical protein
LELSYLWRLPDGAEVTGKDGRCIFSRNAFFNKSKAIELNIEILINDGSCATITGTKRRTLITIVVLMFTICGIADFSFYQTMILRPVNAWNCSEYQNVNG